MPLPVTYRRSAEGGLINYSFADVSTGLGVVTFYSFGTTSSGATVQRANSTALSAITSVPTYTTQECVAGAGTKFAGAINFDNPPNKYQTRVGGEAIVEISHAVATSAGVDAEGHLVIKVQRVSGTDASVLDIGEITTQTISAGASATVWATRLLKIALTDTNIRPDDYLRLNINIWLKTSTEAAESCRQHIPHNPANADIAGISLTAATNHSYLKWHVPFRVEI